MPGGTVTQFNKNSVKNDDFVYLPTISRWWQLRYFLFNTPKIGVS